MQAAILPAGAAWFWIKQAYDLFKSQPMAMLFWSVATSFFINILSLMPIFGQIFLIVFTPIIAFLTLCACKNINNNVKMRPDMWLKPLKQPGLFNIMMILGLAYLMANLIAAFIAVMPFMSSISATLVDFDEPDINAFIQAMSAPLTIFGIFYVIISALFWHTPALIGWHQISIKRSLFYSMVACWRNKYPIAIYILIWVGLFYGLHFLINQLIAIGFSVLIISWLTMLIDIFITAILYCSFYAIYTSIFENPRYTSYALTNESNSDN